MQNPTQPAKPAAPPKPVPPPEFQAEKINKLQQADLIALLKKSDATTFEKAKACMRLAQVGDQQAAAALAALLTDTQMSHYARYGLEPLPGSAADDALRAALPKVNGVLLVGIINSIGKRKDPQAVPALTRLMTSPDPEVARASIAALGQISGPAAMKSLRGSLARSKGPIADAVAAASLVCAEGLLAQGNRTEALALYSALTAPSVYKPARLAAMRAIIDAETSLTRPR